MRKLIPALFFCLHGPAAASAIATGSAPAVPWVRLVLSLLFCATLAWAAVALLRRHQRHGVKPAALARLRHFIGGGAMAAAPRLKILETRRASQHGDLCLAELDGETYLLALTPGGVTVLNRAAIARGPAAGEGA